MVTYAYTVSPGGPTTTIQEAIDNIVFELSSDPTIERDIEVSVADGTYSGFTIPNGSLFSLLNSSYRLIIQSAGTYFPIVDFNKSPDTQLVGADFGGGNPNVTIKGLRFQFFAVGVRVGLNSHFPKIEKCIISNNRNAGIFIEQADESQVLQNVVVNGDYGIVARLCKDIALIHNTVFLNGQISTTEGRAQSAIWCESAHDYGGGLSETGTIHLIGNVAWNTTGNTLTLFQDDVEREGGLVSNFNDWVVGDEEKFITLEDRVFYRGAGSRPRAHFTSLRDWRTTGQDEDSKSEDPKFIHPVKLRTSRNGFAIDLNLLPISPVLAMVPSFYVDPTATSTWLPTYVDSSELNTDIINERRLQAGTAAGANDKASTAGFFGQDIFTNPLDLGLDKNCAVDPLFNILLKRLDIWFPQLHVGYFYSYEREYYLYAKKVCRTLGETAATTFTLPSRVVQHLPIVVHVNGVRVEDPEYIDVAGDEVTLYHRDLNIINGNEELEIQCWVASWEDEGFAYHETHYVFKINEGKTVFLLDEDYHSRGPVVVTDDSAFSTDHDELANREFSVSLNSDFDRAELKFANDTNQVYNSQFEYFGSERIAGWASSGASAVPGEYPAYSVSGPFTCSIDLTGYIRQLFPLESGTSSLSWHAATTGGGTLGYNLHFYDHNLDDLGYVVTGSIDPTGTFQRYYMMLGATGARHAELIPTGSHNVQFLTGVDLPDRIGNFTLTLEHFGNTGEPGPMLVDGVQLEKTDTPTLYHRKPFFNEMTVEFETDISEYFVDTRQAIAPVRNLMTEGFLYIPELPAKMYGGPNTPIVTTLHEWRWQDGRKNLLPWARTQGKDKLRKRPENLFHSVPMPKTEIIAPVGASAEPFEIRISPDTPAALQGDQNGVGFSIQCVDTDGNPFAQALFTAAISDRELRFPGYLHKKIFGLKEQLGQTVFGYLGNAGDAAVVWIPPRVEDSRFMGKVPKTFIEAENGERVSTITTKYPVNLDYHGNVLVLDNNGNQLPTKGTVPILGFYEPAYGNQTSKITVEFPVVPGSVRVVVGGEEKVETFVSAPDSDQFFVDYENSQIVLKGRVEEAYVEYLPGYTFVNQADPYHIMFYHDRVFGTYQDTISVGYDFTITLDVGVENPGRDLSLVKSFDLVAQNFLLSRRSLINTSALEI
jgi:parallel beta-helix repeat protein